MNITEYYILGIKEAREYKTVFSPSKTDIIEILKNLKSCLKQGFSSDMNQVFKGERDFWKRQLKAI